MGKRRKGRKQKAKKLKGEAAVAWFNELRRGRPWKDAWAAFLAKPGHREWWSHYGPASPLYAIPPAIASHLSVPPPGGAPIFCDRDVRIEIAFYRLCRAFRADIVGVWDGRNVPHPLLGQSRSLSQMFQDNPERWELRGWSDVHKAALRRGELEERSDVVRRNLIRQAGRLVSSKEFLNERDNLRRTARELDLSLEFPLTRGLTRRADADPGDTAGEDMEERLRQFADQQMRFFNRWALTQLTTWDLPVPQGPLEEMPLGTLVTLFGADAVVSNVYPEYFTIPRSDQQERLGRIRFPGSRVEALGRAIELERADAEHDHGQRAGVEALDGATKPKRRDLYERAYQMWFCEFALRQRFQDMRLPKGAVTLLISAFAEMLDVEEERVKAIRKLYRPRLP